MTKLAKSAAAALVLASALSPVAALQAKADGSYVCKPRVVLVCS